MLVFYIIYVVTIGMLSFVLVAFIEHIITDHLARKYYYELKKMPHELRQQTIIQIEAELDSLNQRKAKRVKQRFQQLIIRL